MPAVWAGIDAGKQAHHCVVLYIRPADQIVVTLRLLTAHRLDVIRDRVRAIARLRATLPEYFSALEAAFDYSKHKAALTLLSRYATPESLRRIGTTRLTAWLCARQCRNSAHVAQIAITAAHAQTVIMPAYTVGAVLVTKLAATTTQIDADLQNRCHDPHPPHAA